MTTREQDPAMGAVPAMPAGATIPQDYDVLEYPFVFYPVGLNLRGRRCVVIGDDREAIEKDEALRVVGADVVWFKDAGAVTEADVAEAYFVIYTPQEEPGAILMREYADRHKFLLCAIDQPVHGFVAMQATVAAGPVRIAVSTGGIAPRVGGKVRAALQGVMDDKFERFIACLNAQRERNKRWIPDSATRRKTMIGRAEGFEIDVAVRYPQWFEDELAAQAPAIVTQAKSPAGHAGDVASDVAGAAVDAAHVVVKPRTRRERVLSAAFWTIFIGVIARELTRR